MVQVDFDGTINILGIRVIAFDFQNNPKVIVQNHFDGSYTIQANEPILSYRVYDARGRLIIQNNDEVNQFDFNTNYSDGAFFIVIQFASSLESIKILSTTK